jgi:hypothetical protein
MYLEDLEALKQESGVEEVYGDVLNLNHRVRPRELHSAFAAAWQ